MEVKLETITPNAELNIVKIARVSSKREDKEAQPEKLLNYLIKNHHWSPFQHSYLTFEIVTSKAIAIQYLRHLSFTFQEFSQRYAEVENIEPIEFRLQANQNRQSSTDVIGVITQAGAKDFIFDLDESFQDENKAFTNWLDETCSVLEGVMVQYKKGLELGIAKETVRMILPMATQTTLYMTGNVRSWIHAIQLRVDGHAQKEARLIAEAIKDIFITNLPIVSKALGWVV